MVRTEAIFQDTQVVLPPLVSQTQPDPKRSPDKKYTLVLLLTGPCTLRAEWAQARQTFFSSGKNKTSLDAIERAAFFVALDEESHCYNPNDEASLSLCGKALLHGNCYNRCVPRTQGSEVRVQI